MAGLLAAASLARRFQKPLGLHFSDPYPNSWDPRDFLYAAKLKTVGRLVRASAFVTFVTAEALRFTEQQLKLSLSEKAFVLPHIAPPPLVVSQPARKEKIFLYAGRFYGRRNPACLLEGFRLHAAEHPEAAFHYVGPNGEWIQKLGHELNLADRIKTSPYADNLRDHLAVADVLVATDADDPEPVFLTTKVIEYLNTNRKVLLVSPPHSPGSKLVNRFPETALHVIEEPAAIANAMRQLSQSHPAETDFAKRLEQMTSFSAASIAAAFVREVSSRLKLRTRIAGKAGLDQHLPNE